MGQLENIKILVPSCDKNVDIFEAFHICLEKYWPDHPEVIYSTETVINPYYKTICKNYSLENGTKRIRETLSEINCNKVLLIMDDLFIRQPVDTKRVEYVLNHFNDTIACFNFEKQFDDKDLDTNLKDFKMRNHGASYEVSIMCGLGDKNKLIDILSRNSNPGAIELEPDSKGYDFYINSGDYIIDGGYRSFCPTGIFKGKGMRETVKFLESQGIKVNTARGFYD